MTADMQCWDANGNLLVDFTTRLARVLGSQYIDGIGSDGSGSLMDTNLSQGEPFAIFQPEGLFNPISGDSPRPNIIISGNTISWSYSPAATNYHKPVRGMMFYGVR